MANLQTTSEFLLEMINNMTLFFALFRISGHPLAQSERCLHMFLQDPVIDKNYVAGKIRTT